MLFVCTGNIFRSLTAEHALRHALRGRADVHVWLGQVHQAAGDIDLAREESHRVDRQSLRNWAEAHGTWRDAATRTAAVFRGQA